MQKEGQNLMDELMKQDKITSEEVEMILEDCQLNHGPELKCYDQIANILNKILDDVNKLHKQRQQEIFASHEVKIPAKWTTVEVAQLLVAVFNLGEGEWYEIQKRIDFSSSTQIKTPNQVAHRWKQIKRVMKRDIQQVKRETNFSKIITKHEWIIQTLDTMAK